MTIATRTNPCRSCALIDADKNNATCLQCRRRVAYVAALEQELRFSAGRMPEAQSIAGWGMASRAAGLSIGRSDESLD